MTKTCPNCGDQGIPAICFTGERYECRNGNCRVCTFYGHVDDNP